LSPSSARVLPNCVEVLASSSVKGRTDRTPDQSARPFQSFSRFLTSHPVSLGSIPLRSSCTFSTFDMCERSPNGLTPAAKERSSGMFWQGSERETRDRLSWAAVYSSKQARGVAGTQSAPIAPICVYTLWICKTSLKSRLPMHKSWNIGCHLFRTRAGLERTKSI